MKKRYRKIINKIMSMNMIISISFASIFSFPINTNAEETYTGMITSNDVRLRSKPTTENENGVSNKIMDLDEGTVVTVLSLKKEPATSKCTDGWYHVSYQNHTGYICSVYVNINGIDQYDRPWTTPKKAIVGGAKFIAKTYIAKGQFTSYLKKFNVNPDSYYDMFNHQYMANLAAPSSEAKTSWSTYSKNGLSNLPLSFNIPVYSDMLEVYDRPTGNLTTVDKQTEVTDQAFEEYLNAQGFPDSYKAPLRALHTIHPNWTFVAMHTGVSFDVAIMAEKNVSSIQGGSAFYDYSTGKEVQTEKGWYLANDATVAYYLDPRNFLTEKYILQFESLENSSNYTKEVVQSVLNNTFMSDLSVLDNEMYADIFIEAGTTSNVSAVYLASLAIQESGTTVRSTTSGDTFEYEGVTYSGLFNFFNIGASSSASNPSKAGLVYASGGACTICSGDSTNIVIPIKLSNYITTAGYKINDKYVNGFVIGQTSEEIKTKLQNDSIIVNSGTGLIATGTTISYNDESYTVVLYGDLTGDGEINSSDLLKMRQHLLGTSTLQDAYFKAGAITDNSTISSSDLLKIRQHLLGTSTISQG